MGGWTSSTDLPATPEAYDVSYNGGSLDIFVSKFNNDLARLLKSTYLGGSGDDGYRIRVLLAQDKFTGNIVIAGTTNSTNFPTTPGAYDVSHNGGYDVFIAKLTPEPTVITLASFNVILKSNKVILKWITESEIDNAGFNIYRAESENGEYEKVNSSLVLAYGSGTQGASYEFIDNCVKNRKTYYYKLEDIDLNGNSTMHGPLSATPRWIFGFGR